MDPRYYYAALGLSPGATEEEIGKAYRKFARKYHPDLNTAPSAIKKFQELNEAYWVLSDPHRRRDYDQARMNSITDKDSLETRFSRGIDLESAGPDVAVPARRSTPIAAKPMTMPKWLKRLWSPKVVAPCVVVLAIAGQWAFGTVPFLPGAWTGVSGTLAPIASTFEAVNVQTGDGQHVSIQVVRIKSDGTFRAVLAPGAYTLWVSDSSCAGKALLGGATLSLGNGQHVDLGQPPFLSCAP